jgi:hypothetical protein
METAWAGAAPFPATAVLGRRLDDFLKTRGIDRDTLRREADQGLGAPALAVAGGSVLAGFGNHRSDIDLLVLVDNERLTRFPIQSHEHGTLIDINLRRAEDVRGTTAALAADPWPTFATVTEPAWNHRRRAINTAGRLALGLPLLASPPWDSWHASLRRPWLAEAVRQWWAVEAHRRARAAGWLAGARPRAAAVRAREAVVAALNARAAARGELYSPEKWVGEKLRLLGDTEGLAVLAEALEPPDRPGEAVARLLGRVEQLIGEAAPLHSVLRWATGAGIAELDDRTVVDRWQLRALELPPCKLPATGTGAVIWSGPAAATPPEEILPLFVHDMVWLGMARPDPEVSP